VDKNSIIGLGLIAVILGVWLYFSGPSKEQIARNKRIKDSLALVEKKQVAVEAAKVEVQQATQDSLLPTSKVTLSDSALQAEVKSKYRDFAPALSGKDEDYILENDKIKLRISNKGAIVQRVELKEYHRPNQTEPLVLFEKDSTRFALVINAYDRSRIFLTDEFYFNVVEKSYQANT
jgi:YidC/Oxa1 family membrane protein insertase